MHNDELIGLTRRLLDSVRKRDWKTYESLTDESLTCFEPETCGHLVEGLPFHRFYFEPGPSVGRREDTIVAPHVRMLGSDAALVCYTRLIQREGSDETESLQETRVWHRTEAGWRHVHFHRSPQR